MNADYQVKVISSIPLGGQFSLSILQNLRWEAVGDIKYVILVEDSDTGGPSSKSLISIFVPGVTQGNEDSRLVQPLPSLVFNLSGAFHHHRSYGRNLRSQCQGGY